MKLDVFFFGTVPMPDAGDPSIAPTSRRYGNSDVLACYENMLHWAQTADGLGYDTMWLTEHHFQHEGYEVLPNLILFGVHAASRTEHLRFGQMFNVVPQWHPLRLAEDFALAHYLTGGRMEFGVGRGTVPREAESLGTVVASGDNEMAAELDRINREVFEESMEIIKLAWNNERFAFPGSTSRCRPTASPTAAASSPTSRSSPARRARSTSTSPSRPPRRCYVPRQGHKAVYWLQHPESQREKWDRYAELRAEAGTPVGPGDDRCLVLNVHVAPTREAAYRRGRPGHDEFCKFLAPYGRFSSYRQADGSKVPFGFQPTLEDSVGQRIWAIGSADDVVDVLGMSRELLDLKHLCIFFDFPGLTRAEIDEQLHLVAEEVMPLVG